MEFAWDSCVLGSRFGNDRQIRVKIFVSHGQVNIKGERLLCRGTNDPVLLGSWNF